MLFRILLSVCATGFLAWLVWMQIILTKKKFRTVEQLDYDAGKGISFDRHYAMPLDFCIIAPVTGLIIFLCGAQWSTKEMLTIFLVSAVIIGGCLFMWKDGNEAHANNGHTTAAGWLHAVFALIAVWAILMALTATERPEPVLLLVMGIVVPAFFFVGTHKFLGMVNFDGDAYTFGDKPLSDPIGWMVITISTAVVWWRAYTIIPSSFWNSLG